MGSADRLREKQQSEIFKSGNQVRYEMSQKGKKIKEDQKNKMVELERTKDQADKMREEKRQIKLDAEVQENAALDVYKKIDEENKKLKEEEEAHANRAEAEETFVKFDSNNDGQLDVSELQTRIAFDKNRDGVVDLEEARYFLDDNDQLDLESFVTLGWPRMKPFLMLDSGLFKPPRKETDEDDEDSDDKHAAEDEQQQNEEEAELLNEEDEHQEEEFEEEESDNQQAENTTQPPVRQYDDETQRLIHEANEARNQYSSADREFREIETELNKIRSSLEKDFGPEEEFAPLNGECFTFEDREYIYKLCPFDKTVQQPKNGGGETK